MLAVILTVIAAVAAGVAIERHSATAAHRVRGALLQVMFWGLVPFVAYVNIARAHLNVDALLSMAIAVSALVGAGVVMWRLTLGPLALPRVSAGAAIVCTIQANTAYFGLPLCAALFTHAELAQAVAYDGLISLPMFVLGSMGVGARFGTAGTMGLRAQLRVGLLRNPVLFAVIAGLLVPESWAPHVLVAPSRIAVLALLPISFVIVGVTLGDEAKDGTLRVPPPLTRPIVAVTALRFGFVPLALLIAGALFVDVPAPFYLLAAMPVGVNTVLVGHATGIDLRLTSSSIAWTTTLGLVGVAILEVVRLVT